MVDKNETGIVFDIQRTSLHDGPGIRTTVFLKGCPLRCVWCHNPESMVLTPELSYNSEKCVDCLACVATCPTGAQYVRNGHHRFNREVCVTCGRCVAECAYGALRMIGEEMGVGRVMREVEADIDFYKHSGGGITLSGGEPMLQFNFSLLLLKTAKERGIHTCVETCGFAPQKRYAEIAPFVDLFLFDNKGTGSDLHKVHTGQSNERILSNLDFLYGIKPISLRCPLVPGVNDTDHHLKGIADLSIKYPNLVSVELMAYHEFGRDKGSCVGREFILQDIKTTDAETKTFWLERLAELGCDRAIIG